MWTLVLADDCRRVVYWLLDRIWVALDGYKRWGGED